jgi:hypothetical protein
MPFSACNLRVGRVKGTHTQRGISGAKRTCSPSRMRSWPTGESGTRVYRPRGMEPI